MPLDQRQPVRRVEGLLRFEQHHRCASGQRAEEVIDRQVETQR